MPSWMEPMTGIVIQMVAGALVKFASKHYGMKIHRLLSPLAVAGAAFLLPPDMLVGGNEAAASLISVGVFSTLKNLVQLLFKKPTMIVAAVSLMLFTPGLVEAAPASGGYADSVNDGTNRTFTVSTVAGFGKITNVRILNADAACGFTVAYGNGSSVTYSMPASDVMFNVGSNIVTVTSVKTTAQRWYAVVDYER